MRDMELEVKGLIIEALQLEKITAAEIDSEEALFGDGLGLDSIDALELGVAIRKRYGIKIASVNDEVREHFANVRALARFILAQQEVR
jgi:acyl carrier protein